MPVDTPSLFAQVIQDHLELKRRNADIEGDLPLDRYRVEDPFENHPLFKTEEQARLEETMDGQESVSAHVAPLDWQETVDLPVAAEASDSLWGRTRDFDWGD